MVCLSYSWASLTVQLVKNLLAMQETPVRFLSWEDPLEKGKATLSCILVFLGFPSGPAGRESACNVGDLGKIPGLGRFPWKRAWQPTPVFLPGESPWTEEPGRYSPWGLRVGQD